MIKLDKLYFSTIPNKKYKFRYNKNYKNRPSWIEINLDKRVVFIKVLVNDEAFWYRRYFRSFFFPLENTSEDYKNYYNHIAKNYESFVPHEKEIGSILLNFYKELNISKEIKILDLGAGTGIVAEELVKNGFKDITLLDISKNELDIARSKKILKNIKVIEADLTKTKILGRYDSIIETMVFNELNNSELFKILTNIKNALKKNGLFIMIDRHLIDGLDKFFTELKKGKIKIKTPEGIFDFYFYIGKN